MFCKYCFADLECEILKVGSSKIQINIKITEFTFSNFELTTSKFDEYLPQITCVGECDQNFNIDYPPFFVDCEIKQDLIAECYQAGKKLEGIHFTCEPCLDPTNKYHVVSGSCQIELERYAMRGL